MSFVSPSIIGAPRESETKQGRAHSAASISVNAGVETISGLRLRLKAARLRTDRPRLASRRHGGARRRRRLAVGRRFAHWPYALQKANDLVAAQRLELHQSGRKRFKISLPLGEDTG